MDHKHIAQQVERAKQGEAEAFTWLYNHFAKPLYFTALRMTKNEHDAQDMVQDTMLELHKNLANIQNPQAIMAYMYKAVYTHCLNLNRKKKPALLENEPEANGPLSDQMDTDEEFIPAEYLEKKEMREYVISLINQLEETQRSIILLYYYQQFSAPQIAEILDITTNAVWKRLNRAKTTLKRKIVNGMKVMVIAISTPVLTRIFEIEAEAAFTPEIDEHIYTGLKAKMAASAPVAATTAKASTAATVVKSLLALALVLSIASTGMIHGQQEAAVVNTPPEAPALTLITPGLGNEKSPAGVDKSPPSGDPPQQPSEAAKGHSTPFAATQHSETTEKEEASPLLKPLASAYEADPKAPPVGPARTADMPLADEVGEAEKGTPSVDAPAEGNTAHPPWVDAPVRDTGQPVENAPATPVEPPLYTDPSETMPDQPSPPGNNVTGQPGSPWLAVDNWQLAYPIGSVVTLEQLVIDAGITAEDGYGSPLPFHVALYEQVDFSAKGDYIVFVSARGLRSTVIVTIYNSPLSPTLCVGERK